MAVAEDTGHAKARGRRRKQAMPEPANDTNGVAPETAAPAAEAAPPPEAQATEPLKTATPDAERLKDAAADATVALNPIVGLRPQELLSAAGTLLWHAARQPQLVAKHTLGFTSDLTDVLFGRADLKPDPRDKRFQFDVWEKSAYFGRLMRAWLALRKAHGEWLDDVRFEDPADRVKAKFILDIVGDAVAPTNSLIGNPLAVKFAWDTRGKSLLKGARNLIDDILNNGGLPSQVDKRPFKLGETIATSKGAVVYKTEMMELIQYQPLTDTVRARPLLVVPPQINKYYASDLSPEKSLFQYLLKQGFQLFAVSWRNPGKEHAHWGLAEYVLELEQAIGAVQRITGSDAVNVTGACSGGITLATLLSHLAAKGDPRVNAVTLQVCVLDPRKEDSEVGAFVGPKAIALARAASARKGILSGRELATTFAWLRPNDLIWAYVINNYLLGLDPPPFDILFWNADSTNLPARLHADYLAMYEKQPMANPGTVDFLGHPIDLRAVKQDLFMVAGVTDHITPWKAVYRTTQLVGSRTTFILSSSGHIQSLINPPGNPKARYFHNPETPASPEAWLAGAAETKASWWPTWAEWLHARSGDLKPAPKKLGDRKHKPLYAAPGEYVLH